MKINHKGSKYKMSWNNNRLKLIMETTYWWHNIQT